MAIGPWQHSASPAEPVRALATALAADHFTSSIWAGVIDNLANVSLIKVGAGLLYEDAQMTR